MLKTRYFCFLLLISLCPNVSIFAQSLGLDWVVATKGLGEVRCNSTAVDNAGNIYHVGHFAGTVDFDPTEGEYMVTATVNTFFSFIQKFDAKGNMLWVKIIEGNSYTMANSIAVDNYGYLYITGTYKGDIDFDFSSNTHILSSEYQHNGPRSLDIFILKLDQNANFIWAESIGGTSEDRGTGIAVDNQGGVAVTGYFNGTTDFDNGPNKYELSVGFYKSIFVLKIEASNGDFVGAEKLSGSFTDYKGDIVKFDALGNIYVSGNSSRGQIQKYSPTCNLIWSVQLSGASTNNVESLAVDAMGNVYVTGFFYNTLDFDPSLVTYNVTATGVSSNDYLLKLNTDGSFGWVKVIESNSYSYSQQVHVDGDDLYFAGTYNGVVDFDFGPNVYNKESSLINVFLLKMDLNANFKWAVDFEKGTSARLIGGSIKTDNEGNIFLTGGFTGLVDVNPNVGLSYVESVGNDDFLTIKLSQKGVHGAVFHDFNMDCTYDSIESTIPYRLLTINPGNIIAQTNEQGLWSVKTLSPGNYTATLDTSGKWTSTCPISQPFTVLNQDSFTYIPPIGIKSTAPCSDPEVSIHMPFIRPGFSNQRIYVSVCNNNIATSAIDSGQMVITLDSLLTLESGSVPYTAIGNNQFQVALSESIYPGRCLNFWLECRLSLNATLGQSICMDAEFLLRDSCSLDTIINIFPSGISPCNSSYDGSFLRITPTCDHDSIIFVVQNVGDGDMFCFSQMRLFIDGQLVLIDSLKLSTGATARFAFSGDGRTWRMEVDQHPLMFGNSLPSATIELCGNADNWTPDLFNVLPFNDADSHLDIHCGIVTGSYDPNDKTGFPLGLNSTNDILPNQDIEYLIRFQNTGTDTAFTVVIRDTLSTDLDIYSIRSGVSSHPYKLKIQGPRVLEWTFNNILLPDSTTNEVLSHGFVKFKVKQAANLPLGTILENSASIYFDFNAPIFTNTYSHTIALPQDVNWDYTGTITDTVCENYSLHNYNYTQTGNYLQLIKSNGLDSFFNLNLVVYNVDKTVQKNDSTLWTTLDDSTLTYQWFDYTTGVPVLIEGATDKTYSPKYRGIYAVEMTDENCTYLSNEINFNHYPFSNELGIIIYPNPTNTWLNIDKGFNGEISYKIYDAIGRVYLIQSTNARVSSIDVGGLATGIYYIHFNNGEKCGTYKFVKNK